METRGLVVSLQILVKAPKSDFLFYIFLLCLKYKFCVEMTKEEKEKYKKSYKDEAYPG